MSNLHIDDDTITELEQDNIGGQRSKIDVIATILYICLEGRLKNHIIGKGNLSDSMSNHYLSILLYRNLLESYKDEGNGSRTYYRATRKGKNVIRKKNTIALILIKCYQLYGTCSRNMVEL
jgi:predicted transcriptional regulator